MTKPITPAEANARAAEAFPPEVFEAVNGLLKLRANGPGCITLTQEEVIKAVRALMPKASRSDLFKKGWLDFKQAYRAAGWSVEYDKPGYNESYKASWEFTPKRGRR